MRSEFFFGYLICIFWAMYFVLFTPRCHATLASRAMQHAIPVLAAAGHKRRRTEAAASSSLNNLENYLRAHVRADMMPAFVGDFHAAHVPRRVEASAAAAAPQPPPEDPTSRMLSNLRRALKQ